jgi:hypothetical protein
VDAINPEDIYLRVERQILTRLQRSEAIVFTVKTFLVSVSQLKDENRAEDLLEAVLSMPENLARYKCRATWLDALKDFINGGPERHQ